MANPLTIKMVTPEHVALETTADRVVLPAVEGEMGVLPGHEPFMAQLDVGEIRITVGGELKSYAVSGGFAEILNNTISVFAETAEMADAIDEERAKQALERAAAEAKLGDEKDKMTLADAENALKRARVRLRVAKFRKRRGSSPSRVPESDL
ncbi:MAG: ATP synthase F1 subunit epsilon [Elusimicrobia bacterium CG_4_9_14_3_um_filter_62_55]|nr:MAG: ATP synthase F1 subunit epsilon [Elusimicrobia bacterium CG22_combo_CG10-13_8_21_14_all_63_91]PJA17056.1 MAG: ATP synthase F1 subunit epsilon [Elusimicrobia bacterium CG_4_10_14_0_2_um_filter_63_34]PJB25087.1 MAG: ATP synthase F1 subunit epsilon [Elusimicrobia bacterium CG_4_9_14_3_um_filter_62_55]